MPFDGLQRGNHASAECVLAHFPEQIWMSSLEASHQRRYLGVVVREHGIGQAGRISMRQGPTKRQAEDSADMLDISLRSASQPRREQFMQHGMHFGTAKSACKLCAIGPGRDLIYAKGRSSYLI